ncbi:hypothetical protein [Sphingomonas sp.]|uniref:hypothetical protein n=1 Tax=Sphingomonas sp. TaxID=28214 RepID=UPI003CC61457
MTQRAATGERHPKIAYLVHDINDPAVARRVSMLRAGGAELVVAGFRRDERSPAAVAGAQVIDLGRTDDGALIGRAIKVVATLLRPGALLAAAAGADVVIGRNLECLALARRVRRALPEVRLVYECLDIHRTLLGGSLPARAIQRVEAALLRTVDLLLVSSPAFHREYFVKRPTLAAPALLVENKLLALDGMPVAADAPAAGPPWTIGWFGNLRCRRSFALLSELARRAEGRVRILIAGRASPAVFDDFAASVAAAPHCTYVGPYTPGQLRELYGQCHFAWGIDYFEEGLNSQWLLPNKLYEAAAFGTVPIALRSVETGRWLEGHGAGLLLNDGDPVAQLEPQFSDVDDAAYRQLRAAVDAIPRGDLIAGQGDCDTLLHAIVDG